MFQNSVDIPSRAFSPEKAGKPGNGKGVFAKEGRKRRGTSQSGKKKRKKRSHGDNRNRERWTEKFPGKKVRNKEGGGGI